MNRLKGKTAVITGGATGSGRAAAKRFIEEGAFVFIFGRRQEALDAAVAALTKPLSLPGHRVALAAPSPNVLQRMMRRWRSATTPANPEQTRRSWLPTMVIG